MPKVPKIIKAAIEEGPDILTILAIAFVASYILRRLFRGLKDLIVERMNKRGDATSLETEKNVKTIEAVVGRSLSLLIWAFAILAILKRLDVDISPILTGAGVLGLAVGFGSQTLIKDVIAGMFLLIENQIRVNDSAMINGVAGLVEEVNLRTTVLRAENGGIHIFPNGSITALANLSRDFAHYVFEYMITHDSDVEVAFTAITEAVDDMRKEPAFEKFILAPADLYGVDRIVEQGVVIRGRIKTLPHKQWGVGREANKRIRARFAECGVKLASREVGVRMESGKADALPSREELKAVIREVLRENERSS
jgi:small conductance mechanosensitive channel